jgi:hypothetical protein
VIVITGKQPTPEEILQYGIFIEDFIMKPIDFELITRSFHRIIEKNQELGHEIDRIKNRGQDQELLNEYTLLLRLVRVIHNLKKRLDNRHWAERIPLQKLEDRLQWLHTNLGFPNHIPEQVEGVY